MINWSYYALFCLAIVPFAKGEYYNEDIGTNSTLNDMWGEEWPFSGIQTFAHLPHQKCLLDMGTKFDIGVIGMPFDTAVSYRPGARFGPQGIRKASQRQNSMRGFNFRAGINPYNNWASVIDCGDVPVTPMDNNLALQMMTAAYDTPHLPSVIFLSHHLHKSMICVF